MVHREGIGLLARLWQYGVYSAVATDCDTQALSGFLDSVEALKEWVDRGSSNVNMHQSMLDEGRLKLAVAKDLRILLESQDASVVLRASTVSFAQVLAIATLLCCGIVSGNYRTRNVRRRLGLR